MVDEMTFSLDENYLIKGVLSEGGFSCIFGAPANAKSFAALDLGVAIATGTRWHGRTTKLGGVLYIVLEGVKGFERRIEAMKCNGRLPPGTPFATMTQPLNVFDPSQVDELAEVIKQLEQEQNFEFTLIIIDTLARAMAGTDENSTMDMMAAVEGIQELGRTTGCHTMIVHHSGKDTSKGSRGSSSLKGAVDTEFECTKVPDTDKGFILKTTKQKDMDDSSSFPFRLKTVTLGKDEEGEPVTSCVVEQVKKHITALEATKQDEKERKVRAMVSLLPQPSMTEWYRAAVESKALGEGTTEDSARNFVNRNLQSGEDYTTGNSDVGKKKAVARGPKWDFLELAQNREGTNLTKNK